VKTSLDHLPARKQEELCAIVEIVRAGAPLEMLILFGSHARGDWVEDQVEDQVEDPEGGYFSDYDVLAIVKSPKVAEDVALWSRLETEAREVSGESLVTLIAHDIKFVNREIRDGSYFFGDILLEGVMLYDSKRLMLATPKEASPAERAARAERNFLYWFESADGFLRLFERATGLRRRSSPHWVSGCEGLRRWWSGCAGRRSRACAQRPMLAGQNVELSASAFVQHVGERRRRKHALGPLIELRGASLLNALYGVLGERSEASGELLEQGGALPVEVPLLKPFLEPLLAPFLVPLLEPLPAPLPVPFLVPLLDQPVGDVHKLLRLFFSHSAA
jgi:predicted nucleotidyltransferase